MAVIGGGAASEEDGGEEGARGGVVEAETHEGHGLGDAESVREAPAEECGVAGGHEDAGAGDGVGGGEECAEVGGCFGGGVAEEADERGVGGDAAITFGDESGAALDGFCEIGGAVEAVDGEGEYVAGGEVCGCGGAHGAAGDLAR